MSCEPVVVFLGMDEARAAASALWRDRPITGPGFSAYTAIQAAIARRLDSSGDHFLGEANEGFEA